MKTMAYRLLPESHLERIRMRLSQTLHQWQKDWGASLSADIEHCHRAWETDARFQAKFQGTDFRSDPHSTKRLHIHLSPEFRKRLPLFTDESTEILAEGKKNGGGEIAALLATQATQALLDALKELFGDEAEKGVENTMPPYRHGSGWAAIKIVVGRETLCLLAHPAAVQHVQETPTAACTTLAPVDLQRALSTVSCRTRALVGDALVDIASMATLAVGDIIALEQPIAVPLKVLGEVDEPLFHAHIGTCEGRLALRLFPL